MTITAYKFDNDNLPADFQSDCMLPVEIVVLPSKAIAIYDGEDDVEYPDLATLLDHHDGAQIAWYREDYKLSQLWAADLAAR